MSGWDDILRDGETVVWQGQPDDGITLDRNGRMGVIVGGTFAFYYLLGLYFRLDQMHIIQILINLGMTCVGLYMVYNATLGAAGRRRRTWYSLTTERAFIATLDARGQRQLQGFDITPVTQVKPFEDHGIMFAKKVVTNAFSRHQVPVGFMRLNDRDAVLAQMKQMQGRLQ